jgi:hypothetical protein
VAVDDPLHLFEVTRQKRPKRLGIARLAGRGRAGDIAEEDGDGLPVLERHPQIGELGAAAWAEGNALLTLTATA